MPERDRVHRNEWVDGKGRTGQPGLLGAGSHHRRDPLQRAGGVGDALGGIEWAGRIRFSSPDP